jgi:hypothetical protein
MIVLIQHLNINRRKTTCITDKLFSSQDIKASGFSGCQQSSSLHDKIRLCQLKTNELLNQVRLVSIYKETLVESCKLYCFLLWNKLFSSENQNNLIWVNAVLSMVPPRWIFSSLVWVWFIWGKQQKIINYSYSTEYTEILAIKCFSEHFHFSGSSSSSNSDEEISTTRTKHSKYGPFTYASVSKKVLSTLHPLHNFAVCFCTEAFRMSEVGCQNAESGDPALAIHW